MKFLIHANAPTIPTGYGVQCRHLADKLTQAGHEVAVSSTYGHQGGIGSWTTPHGHDVRLYPSGYEINSPDVVVGHAEHWFEGDPKSGWIIFLVDIWGMKRPVLMRTLRDFNVISWCPVDHWPVPPHTIEALQGIGAVPLAMCEFGQQQLTRSGLDAALAPLAVDTDTYRPSYSYRVDGRDIDSRTLFDLPLDAFVVGMVAMNKDPQDRKGFGEAFQAFAEFWKRHHDAVLFVHTDAAGGAGGLDLRQLAAYAGVPQHALVFSNQYGYRLGLPPDMLACAYTAMDVLLAPSRGEGFCVPLIEAQACGTPVIASDFTAQSELIGPGWSIGGQLQFNPTQSAYYQTASIADIIDRLEDAYESLATDPDGWQRRSREFAEQYSVDRVWNDYWMPFLATLEPPELVERPAMESVDVIVPMMRPKNLDRLRDSLNEPRANLIVMHDTTAVPPVRSEPWRAVSTMKDRTGFAEKVNLGVEASSAGWVLIVGDDVEFADGWFDAAVEASRWYDVVGTNDSEPGRVRNPAVASGSHADHFFIRRAYIDDEGSSLDGPGVAMPTAYGHWFVDREVVELAKARGVFGMAADCRIVHHHPGYDGDEDARQADPVYMAAVDTAGDDQRTWAERQPLIDAHRVTRVGA